MQVRSTNAAWVGLVFSPLLVLVFISLSAGGALHTTECRYCRKSMVLYPDLPDSLSLPLSSLPLSSNQVGALAHVTKRQITKAAVCFGTAEWLKFTRAAFLVRCCEWTSGAAGFRPTFLFWAVGAGEPRGFDLEQGLGLPCLPCRGPTAYRLDLPRCDSAG